MCLATIHVNQVMITVMMTLEYLIHQIDVLIYCKKNNPLLQGIQQEGLT
jgi:hypothetical protein